MHLTAHKKSGSRKQRNKVGMFGYTHWWYSECVKHATQGPINEETRDSIPLGKKGILVEFQTDNGERRL